MLDEVAAELAALVAEQTAALYKLGDPDADPTPADVAKLVAIIGNPHDDARQVLDLLARSVVALPRPRAVARRRVGTRARGRRARRVSRGSPRRTDDDPDHEDLARSVVA